MQLAALGAAVRSLTITERYGQYVVTTSDGKKATSATLEGALRKAFPYIDLDGWEDMFRAFSRIKPSPDGGQIHEGPVGA